MKYSSNVKSRSLLTSLAQLAGRSSRRSDAPGRLQLFSMGGTFGRGVIKHCDTWEVGDATPEVANVRQDMHYIAQRRREEAIARLHGEKKRGFYDFLNR